MSKKTKKTADQERQEIVRYLQAMADQVPAQFAEALRQIAGDIEAGDAEGFPG